MAVVHNALSRATELIRGYRRAFGFVEAEGGVERFSETVHPVMDIWRQPEWAVLRGDRLLHGYQSSPAAGAGTRSCIQIYHDDINSVCLVEDVVVSTTCFGHIEYGVAVALANLSLQYGTRDTRLSGWSGTRVYWGAPAAAPGTPRIYFPTSAIQYRVNLVIHALLGAATSLVFHPGVDNTALTVGFTYRIHPLLPGESVGA